MLDGGSLESSGLIALKSGDYRVWAPYMERNPLDAALGSSRWCQTLVQSKYSICNSVGFSPGSVCLLEVWSFNHGV